MLEILPIAVLITLYVCFLIVVAKMTSKPKNDWRRPNAYWDDFNARMKKRVFRKKCK